MKILIAVPTYETISPDTFKSIYRLDRSGHDCVFDFVRGYDCAAARTNIARQAMDEGADYVLMVDNDVVLLPDALANLLELEPDVCFGYYPHRNAQNVYDGRSSACRLGELNYTQQYPLVELQGMREREEYRALIHGGGMGCALIRTDVFRRIGHPWFQWINYENGEVLSEDLFFCEQCHKAGIPIYVDTRVRCGHIFRHVQW